MTGGMKTPKEEKWGRKGGKGREEREVPEGFREEVSLLG